MKVQVVNTRSERLMQTGVTEEWEGDSFWVAVTFFGKEHCLIARSNLKPIY